jgi:hypothetical protein
MTDEERALELLESARKKVMRAATYAPDMSADFADAICGLEELVEDLEDQVEDGDDDEEDDTD